MKLSDGWLGVVLSLYELAESMSRVFLDAYVYFYMAAIGEALFNQSYMKELYFATARENDTESTPGFHSKYWKAL